VGPGEIGREASCFTFGYYDSEKSTGDGDGDGDRDANMEVAGDCIFGT
jgi:hypothetical protein